MGRLIEALYDNAKSDNYPFHMPGHKRQLLKSEPCDILSDLRALDITEIDGFDNLQCPENILVELQQRAAKIFGADESFILVNGSSGGILSAISACTSYGGKLIVDRGCHKSVYNGIFIRGLTAEYIYFDCGVENLGIRGVISPDNVDKLLSRNPDSQAVVITSPTYEGIISDIKEISRVVHKYGIPLIVDCAHGSHLGFMTDYETPCRQGADIVIQSLHKTLPCPTQTSILHVCGDIVDRKKLKDFINIYQTSSPSYLFMAAIERCLDILESDEALFTDYERLLEDFYSRVSRLNYIRTYTASHDKWDLGKIIIYDRCISSKDGMCGRKLYEQLLNDYHLQLEMYSAGYALAMTSVMDTEDGFNRLALALEEIDSSLTARRGESDNLLIADDSLLYPQAVSRLKISQAEEESPTGCYSLEELCGLKNEHEEIVSLDYIYAYPPGIPIIAPGEELTKEIFDFIKSVRNTGVELSKTSAIRVIING